MHLVRHPAAPASDSPATAATEDRRWVLLECRDCRGKGSLAAEAETIAESRTSFGQHLRVSFRLAAPLASSFLCYNCSDDHINAIAAHGDSVLLRMNRRRRRNAKAKKRGRDANKPIGVDHFVYRSGGTARPPSLSLLPPRNIPVRQEEGTSGRDPYCRYLYHEDTGVLRRGEDDLLVAQLEVMPSFNERRGMADLCILRHGRSQWDLKRSLPIVHNRGAKGDEELDCWESSRVIPAGNRYLCWAQSDGAFIVCDMAEETTSPKLRYVPRPLLPYDPSYYNNDEDLLPMRNTMSLSAAGCEAVRFITVEPRCCCRGFGRSTCARSRFAFTVTTWTLTLTMDGPMTWVKDSVLDCEEIWALPGYEGVPRVYLENPMVSLDNPDAVCFKVISNADKQAWKIEVDMRRKMLLAAIQCTIDPWETYYYLPARLQG